MNYSLFDYIRMMILGVCIGFVVNYSGGTTAETFIGFFIGFIGMDAKIMKEHIFKELKKNKTET